MDYKDTNAGSYAKIMATLNANSLTSVVVIPPTVNDESKDAIINLSLKFNIPYVILPDLTNPYFHYEPRNTGYKNDVHYNDLGYSYIGNCLVTAINNLTITQLYYLLPHYN